MCSSDSLITHDRSRYSEGISKSEQYWDVSLLPCNSAIHTIYFLNTLNQAFSFISLVMVLIQVKIHGKK